MHLQEWSGSFPEKISDKGRFKIHWKKESDEF